MEVTKSNFKELRSEIDEAIKSCSFMAIDGEFTGLNNGSNISPFDTPSHYYSKVLSGSLDFLFVQFGLSVFTHISDTKYDNKTYIFYLFPEPMNRDAPDCRFLCQSSSLGFLAKHGFDFNKLFKDGIPYLKQSDEEAMREALECRRKAQEANAQCHIDIPPNQKPVVDQAMESIKTLLDPENEKNEVKIEKCSGFVRKLVYQTFKEELSNSGISLETVKGVLVAKKGATKDQLDKEKSEKLSQEEEDIQTAVGFVSIIKSIINSGKLIVGHNVLLDLCHLVNQFVDHLPNDYLEFKEMLHDLFPKIVDTKYLCSDAALKDLFPSTFLPSVLETVSQPPFELPDIVSEENRSFLLNSEKYHNSGYDAFVTGVCFLAALRHLESNDKRDHSIDSPLLDPIVNRLYLMRVPDSCIHLGGKDPEPHRDHVFHVSFPKTWNLQHLQELFSPFGSIQVSWVNDTSAWVGLHDRRESERAKKLLEGKSNKLPGVVVTSYSKFYTSVNAVLSSPRPPKRRADTNHDNVFEMDGKRDSSKRKKSKFIASDRSITTIYEETNQNNDKGVDAISPALEQTGTSSTDVNFAVNEDWN